MMTPGQEILLEDALRRLRLPAMLREYTEPRATGSRSRRKL